MPGVIPLLFSWSSADILQLFSLPGLGAKKIKALYEELKVSSIADLNVACEAGAVARFSRLWQDHAGEALPGDC